MKYISRITLSLALCTALAYSCKEEEGLDTAAGISVDKETISIGPDGGIETVKVTAGGEWTSSSSQPWVLISPANGYGSVDGTLAIDSTLEVGARTAQVRFRQSDNQEKIVTINQFGYGKQIILDDADIEVESAAAYDDRCFDVTISTNVAFKIEDNIEYAWGEEIPESEKANVTEEDLKGWIGLPNRNSLVVDLDRKDRPRTVKIQFRWEMNTAPYKRVAKIKLVPQDSSIELVDPDGNPIGDVILTVTQEAALKITDDRRGDSLAIVMINQKIQSMMAWEYGKNMANWEAVTLWEEDSEDKPKDFTKEWIGRVRSVEFRWFDLDENETFPREIKYLKYLEGLSIQTNVNSKTKSMHLGEDICNLNYLKKLNLFAYGLVELPDNFQNLGETLEYLEMSSNNFGSLSDIVGSDRINKEVFPHLKGLTFSTSRRDDTTADLSATNSSELTGGEMGLYADLTSRDRGAFMELLKLDSLEYLTMAYMYMEGSLPSDEDLQSAGFKAYTNDDFTKLGLPTDTLGWLLKDDKPIVLPGKTTGEDKTVTGQDVLKVWPKMKEFAINLNFLTGELPNWILFHPYFMHWNPEGRVITQWTKGKDTKGSTVGFENTSGNNPNFNFKYYYGDGTKDGWQNAAYPGYYNKYAGGGTDWTPEAEGSAGTTAGE